MKTKGQKEKDAYGVASPSAVPASLSLSLFPGLLLILIIKLSAAIRKLRTGEPETRKLCKKHSKNYVNS